MSTDKNIAEEPLETYGQPANFRQVWQMFQETEKMFRENAKELDKRFKETDEKFKETDEKFKETDRKMKELQELFTLQWGKLMESLVEGDLIKLLNNYGIKVEQTLQRVKGIHDGNPFEFDILAINGKEVVVVEVKTTLRVDDVKQFITKMRNFKKWLPLFKDKTVYGAVAYLTSTAASHVMAEKNGFFVIRATGSSASIINKEGFKPVKF
jgi:hypothetical protein